MLKRKEFVGNRRIWIALFITFIASTVFRGIIAMTYGEYTVFGDEFLHVKLAQNIAAGHGLVIRGVLFNYTECLYSIVIAPVFLLTHNTETAHILILWINAALMSSAVFPIYLIARKFLSNTKHIWVAVAYGVLFAEMNYTLQAMQENLNYPLMLWFFLAFTYVILEKRHELHHVIALGVFAFLLSRCKQMNLAIVYAVPLYFVIQFLIDKRSRRQTVRNALIYIGAYTVIKLPFDFAMNILLADAVSDGNLINSISQILHINIILKLIYPAILYVIFTVIATGIVPLPILIGNWRLLSEISRQMLTFILTYLFMSIGAICVLIVPNENLGDEVIRFHSRYFFYAFIMIMVLFLQVCEENEKDCERDVQPLFLLGSVVCLVIFLPINPAIGAYVDGESTLTLCRLGLAGNETLLNTVRCIIILTLILGMYFVYKQYTKKIYWLTAIILILSIPIHSYFCIVDQNDSEEAHIAKTDALLTNDYILSSENTCNHQEETLLLAGGDVALFQFETYLNFPYKYTQETLQVGEEISFPKLQLRTYQGDWYDIDATMPEYIISSYPIDFQGYDELDIGLIAFHLFRKNGDIAKRLNSDSNIYGDNWLGETAAQLQYAGTPGCTEAVLSLSVDNWLLGIEAEVNYTDGSGYSGSFTIPPTAEETMVEIPIYKPADAVAYEVTITPTQAIQPDNGDSRLLSFRLFDYQLACEK